MIFGWLLKLYTLTILDFKMKKKPHKKQCSVFFDFQDAATKSFTRRDKILAELES